MFRQFQLQRVGVEQLGGEAPQVIQRLLDLAVADVVAVAQADHPAVAEAQVIIGLLQRLGGDGGDLRIAAAAQRLVQLYVVGIEQELTHQRVVETAVRLLRQQQVMKLAFVAAEGQAVFAAGRAGQFGGITQKVARLAEQIEPDVGQRQIDFQLGRVAAPGAQALGEDQRRVALAEQIADARIVNRHGRLYMFLMPSGMV